MNPDIMVARELARKLLLRQKPARLPIRVECLRFDKSLIIDSIQHYCALTSDTVERLCAGADAALRDGCTLARLRGNRKTYIILYNERMRSIRRRGFTLAHEVGHIYLEHAEDGAEQERQADAFAAELLMPRILAAEYLMITACAERDKAAALSQAFAVSLGMARLGLRSPETEEPYTVLEKELLDRYGSALPRAGEPEISY